MMKLKAHPYAELFPMMSAAELEALTADIAANGLRTKIVRYQGMILDGRNCHAACEAAGITPGFTDFEGDDEAALALVWSSNMQRRDLTASQRAIVAAKVIATMPERRGGDPGGGGGDVRRGPPRRGGVSPEISGNFRKGF
jgi:hypothetical protein